MTNFRIVAQSLVMVNRLIREGHSVSICTQDTPLYSGEQATFVFESPGWGHMADQLKSNGHPVYGGGALNDRIGLDRAFGLRIAAISGVKTPRWNEFDSFADARAYMEENPAYWTVVPQTSGETLECELTMRPEAMLQCLEAVWPDDRIVLYQKPAGVPLTVGGFYVDAQLVPGSLHIAADSQVRFCKSKGPKIYRLTLALAEKFLKRFNYCGPLYAYCVVDGKDKLPYLIRWRTAFDPAMTEALYGGLNMGLGELLAELAAGRMPKLEPSYDWLGQSKTEDKVRDLTKWRYL